MRTSTQIKEGFSSRFVVVVAVKLGRPEKKTNNTLDLNWTQKHV